MSNLNSLVAPDRSGERHPTARRYSQLRAIFALSLFAVACKSATVSAAEPESISDTYTEISAFDSAELIPASLSDTQWLNGGQLVLAPQLSFSGWNKLVMQAHSDSWQLALKLSMVEADAVPQLAEDLSLRESSSLHLHFQYRF